MEKEKSRFLKSENGTVYDSLTSLTWMSNDSKIDLNKEVSWDEAEKYAADVNNKKIGGYDDWRIPSAQEALTLFDKNKLNKDFKGGDIHLDSIFPPGAGNTTWTSEIRGREAQIIFYINGLPYWYEKEDKTLSHAVRLIRRD
ncbi:uncharacterized protein METZ01_LOCUS416909 [marine metagenome]|uniref:Lcl C-terminal domain-containing protein n=1 Tax=marine metagenome TaxID=408172 RepID=A0A382X0E2_9ZZZZ